jgi:ribosome biogenesis GTPase A
MNDLPYEKLNIQWYPGHMTKARRMIEEHVSMVDAVCEILDARIPRASRNPDIQTIAGEKPRLVILNRSDLADAGITAEWKTALEREGQPVMVTDAKSGKGVNSFSSEVRKLLADKISYYESKGQAGRLLRCVILGIPNVGKSTFINKAAGRKAALAGDKPGVTRGKQWITLPNGIELLDTPGILWPRFESQEVGELLAITGAIKTEVFDTEALAANLMLRLKQMYPDALLNRYKLQPAQDASGYELLEAAARKRGFLVSGGEADTERMSITLLRELHEGKLGRLSLERPE